VEPESVIIVLAFAEEQIAIDPNVPLDITGIFPAELTRVKVDPAELTNIKGYPLAALPIYIPPAVVPTIAGAPVCICKVIKL
jgi:hypothetical protein